MAVGESSVISGESVPRLVEQLRGGEASLRWKAARSLGRLGVGAEPAVPALAEALHDRSVLLRVAAAEALNMLAPASRPALPALIAALKDHYASVREVAAEALGRFGADAAEAILPLRAALADESPYVRAHAADALVRLGPAVVSTLTADLPGADPVVRAATATILGRMAEPAATLPALRELAEDEHAAVRLAAREAIRNLLRGAARDPQSAVRDDAAEPEAAPEAPLPSEPVPDRPAPTELPNLPASMVGGDESVESGWRIPQVVHLGCILPGATYEYGLQIDVPMPARLTVDVPGLTVEPATFAAGPVELTLRFAAAEHEGPVKGRLRLISAGVKRWIVVRGQITQAANEPSTERVIVWQPLDWESRGAGDSDDDAPDGEAWEVASPGDDRTTVARPQALVPEVFVVRPTPTREDSGGAIQRIEDVHFGHAPTSVRRIRRYSGPRWGAILALLVAVPIIFALRMRPDAEPAPRKRGGNLTNGRSPTPPAPPPGASSSAASTQRTVSVQPTVPAPSPPVPPEQPPPKAAAPVVNSIEMKLTLIPAGRFLMGSPDSDEPNDRPPHEVRLTRPFYLAIHEVTQADWRTVMNDRPNPSWFSPEATGSGREKVAGLDTNRFPVEIVSWLDAVEFCNRLSVKEGLIPYYTIKDESVTVPEVGGKGYRLPTEAEWEYAVRGGARENWFFGNSPSELGDYAWYSQNSQERTHLVGEKSSNPFGLFDVYGNVAEWCWDWDGPYAATPQTNPTGPASGHYRVIRGGGWSAYRADIGSARRFALRPSERHKDTGFRVARTALEPRS